MKREKIRARDKKIVREYLRKLGRKDSPNRYDCAVELGEKYDMSAEGIRLVLIREGVYKAESNYMKQ